MKIIKILSFAALAAMLQTSSASAQQKTYLEALQDQNHWVDSVFKKLNRSHKIAQLFFVRAHTNLGKAYADSVGKVIKKQQLGGVVFFQGGPVRQAVLSNEYQKLAKIPLLVAMDAEWGLGMRLDSTVSYPYQMTLGALQDNSLINKMGQQVATDFKRLGMQLNFAPVMDVNNNPGNPVINYRSFGDNKYNVAAKAIAYMQGMQQGGILTTAKHFPGHGDTNVDSHFDLPQLNFSRQRLDSLEEYPFKAAIAAGISGIMVAHMNIPALDSAKNVPSTLSRPIITKILKDSLGFKGLVVSDAMGMKGVVKFFPEGEADVRAFIAGNDIIELSQDSKRAIKKIKKAIRKDQASEEELDAKVKKVLASKYWAGLNQSKPVDPQNLIADLNRAESRTLIQQMFDGAVTLLQGDSLIQQLDFSKRTALVSIGANASTTYQRELSTVFTDSKLFFLPKDATQAVIDAQLVELKNYGQIIIGIHDTKLRPGSKLDFNSQVMRAIVQMAAYPNTVVSVFANPYTLSSMPGIEKSGALIEAYQKDDDMQRSAVKVITRKLKATGKLPVQVSPIWNNMVNMAME